MTNATEDLLRTGRSKACIISMWVLGILVALAILFIILGLTFFMPKDPVTTVNSVSLQDVKLSFDIAKLRTYINATFLIDLSIKNPNHVGFKFAGSVVYLKYKDQEVGEAPIEEGEIGSNEVKNMKLSLKLMADRLLSDPEVYYQAISGSLPLSTYVVLTGKVRLLFKVTVKTYTTCDFHIDVMAHGLSGLSCHSKTKL